MLGEKLENIIFNDTCYHITLTNCDSLTLEQ